jgi:uncharacterized membrane protein
MKTYNNVAIVSLIGLIFFCLAWELWLAPLHPGGSVLAWKALPLLFAVFGILRSNRYTHQWTSMFSLLYLAEGLVRVGSDPDGTRWAAAIEVILALLLFVGCVGYSHTSAPSRIRMSTPKPAD